MNDEEIVQRFVAGEDPGVLAWEHMHYRDAEDHMTIVEATVYVLRIIRQRLQALRDFQAKELANKRARQRKWREAHPGANVQHTLKWQAENRERLNAYRREWRAKKKAEKLTKVS